MKIIKDIQEMHDYIQSLKTAKRKEAHKIGFVPTMGFFHEGHMSLMNASAKENTKTIVSIYVNPVQFGPGEDFDSYPRDEERDLKMLEKMGKVDCVFMPESEDMYPEGYATYVDLECDMVSVLCGASRQRHFKGVITVVSKLLNIVKPDHLYLGQKDMQQAIIITKMMKELNYDTQSVICPIIREKDGLAMSSRNKYLSPEEREVAPVLYKSMQVAESMIELGEKSAAVVIREIKRKLKEEKVEVDYVEAVDTFTLSKTEKFEGEVLIAAAIVVGKTRLIDNAIVRIEE